MLNLLKLNYEMTEKMYTKFLGKNYAYLILAFTGLVCTLIMTLIEIYQKSKKININNNIYANLYEKKIIYKASLYTTKNYHISIFLTKILDKDIILALFCIIMVSHSVHSFLHEDTIWGVLLILSSFSVKNLLAFCVYLVIGKFPQHDQDRFFRISKINTFFSRSEYKFLGILLVYYLLMLDFKFNINFNLINIVKNVKKYLNTSMKEQNKKCNTNSKKNVFKKLFYNLIGIINKFMLVIYTKIVLPDTLLLLTIVKYIHPASKLLTNYFFLFPTPKTLSLLVYDAPVSFFINFILRKIDIKNCVSLFALSNMTFFLCMNYTFSAVNYDVAFTFCGVLIYEVAALLVFFHVFWPLICVLHSFLYNNCKYIEKSGFIGTKYGINHNKSRSADFIISNNYNNSGNNINTNNDINNNEIRNITAFKDDIITSNININNIDKHNATLTKYNKYNHAITYDTDIYYSLQIFQVLLAMIMSLWFEKTWLFQLFFGARSVFISLTFVVISLWLWIINI
ncbi:hypothetical protein EDEG_01537 [Edhazardia aedis USNM 41457]|uniref:Uncharacterized protein n=1 Tax=Edhazardia aedis (strain USNM 41457) TaxID=1003232 RepID=J9DS85_EDHAE|nr:hypothetical protein EDEG_01537 [Edhazardia aedis USNM 41457]|eukprot:EJW04162.1 hypothetical protein EDEG_01537 [Edhazardia aedis USNM 41457]